MGAGRNAGPHFYLGPFPFAFQIDAGSGASSQAATRCTRAPSSFPGSTEKKEAAVLAGPPPRTPPGTIGRQGHSPANARVVTEMHGSAQKLFI